MSETRAVYAVPALLVTEPTLDILIEVSPVVLLKTSVAEICHELGDNLREMDAPDFARIEALYRQMMYYRDESLKELPLFQVAEIR